MKLTFGKYKYKTLEYVASIDPAYIYFLYNNNIIEVPDDIMEIASESQILDIPNNFDMLFSDCF